MTTKVPVAGLVLAAVAALIAPTAAHAYFPVGSDLRITTSGPAGDPATNAGAQSTAWNSQANEYLVVYTADGAVAGSMEREVFGQRLSAAGTAIGAPFRISNSGPEGDTAVVGYHSAVTYNSVNNEYLVIWKTNAASTGTVSEQIFGQRLSAEGAEIGADFRISNVGADGVGGPDVAYNSTANEYLAVWDRDISGFGGGDPDENNNEVYGQRVSAAGAELGGDFRISNTAVAIGASGSDPAVAYNSGANEYLVTFSAGGSDATGDGFDVFGQRVSAAGGEIGADFGIADAGKDTDASNLNTQEPNPAYNPSANEFFVIWAQEAPGPRDYEVFGARVSAAGAPVGGPVRVSGPADSSDDIGDFRGPGVAYASAANEYVVVWADRSDPGTGPRGVFAQRMSAAAAEIGADFRISATDFPDDPASSGEHPTTNPAITYNANTDQLLATWSVNQPPADREVWGRCLARDATGLCGTPTTARACGLVIDGLNLEGTKKKDKLTGTDRADHLRGGDGNDKISGGAKNDCLYGQDGNDKVKGDAAADILNGGAGNDKLAGGEGNDTIKAQNGNDKIGGGSGDDVIKAQAKGVDRINCGGGKDKVVADRKDKISKSCETVKISGM